MITIVTINTLTSLPSALCKQAGILLGKRRRSRPDCPPSPTD
jgi:hypothetical protein